MDKENKERNRVPIKTKRNYKDAVSRFNQLTHSYVIQSEARQSEARIHMYSGLKPLLVK